MTVHAFVEAMELDQSYKVPLNCTAKRLKYYARSRFDYCLIILSPQYVKRVQRVEDDMKFENQRSAIRDHLYRTIESSQENN